MKKSFVFCAGLCVALAFTSCKSSESAYKKAYEKAQAQNATQATEEPVETSAPVVTPLVEKPVTQTTVTNYDNTPVTSEEVTVVNGAGLQSFSVVVGSFSVKANAEGLQSTLKAAGYDAQLAYNSARNMYRVVATTFATKAEAAQSRDQLSSNYPGAWLLYKK